MRAEYPHFRSAGENAVMLYLGNAIDPAINDWVQLTVAAIDNTLAKDIIDLVPAYASVLVIYRHTLTFRDITRRIRAAIPAPPSATTVAGREITLPAYYAIEVGEDLEALAQRAELPIEDVIDLHASTPYQVYAIGFAPGFAYLGQVDERIAAPRLDTPRPRVPRGSIAIAGRQTAVYPAASPGGWHLIGQCPAVLFDPTKHPHMPFTVGDTVYFEPVNRARFIELGGVLP